MGIFNFLKDVGQKLLDHDQPQAAQNSSLTLAQKLEQKIQQLNLGIQNPTVRIEGDKAIIEGKATSQDALEKTILAVGNTFGISQVDARIESPEQVQPKFYTVKKGDTLSKIAKETLGSANEYNRIFEANRPLLKDPDEIYPGQQLRIPQDVKKAA
jgi:nucleoid-associated protein YgaU